MLKYLARKFREQVRLAIQELAAEPMQGAKQLSYERVAAQLATEASAQYMIDNFMGAHDHINANRLRLDALKHCTVEGLYLEFGVAYAASLKQIAGTTTQEVHGFDSFEGLPEKWTYWQNEGRYTLEGNFPDKCGHENIVFHKGWFDDTLPPFLETHPEPIRFLHIDSDLYSSANTVLTLCESRIVPGTVIQFDEYLNYPGWQQHEHKAWQEFVARTGVKYRYLGFASCQCAVSVVVG